jgi:hypothetical protein
MTNGVNPHATPLQTPLGSSSGGAGKLELVVLVFGLGVGREGTALGGAEGGPVAGTGVRPTPKPKTKTTSSSLPAPPLDDVHAAFVEFRAKLAGSKYIEQTDTIPHY